MAKSPTRIQIAEAARKYLDYDADGYAIQVGHEVGVIGSPDVLLTLNTGRVEVTVSLPSEDLDNLIDGLMKARKMLAKRKADKC